MQAPNFAKITKYSAALLLATLIAVLPGCGDTLTDPAAAVTTTTATTAVASIQMSATPMTVKSDNSNSATITISAVSTGNAAVPDVKINLSADSGLLDKATVTTDATGMATATFSSGAVNKANRTATITASNGVISGLLPLQVVGSTLTLNTSATALVSGGTPAPMTIDVLDAGGAAIAGTAVTLSQTGGGTVTVNPASGTTDANGKLVVSVTGATAGAVTLTASAAGVMASVNMTVTSTVASTFGISLLTRNAGAGVVPVTPKAAAMKIGDTLKVQVNAPAPIANVIFATTVGTYAECNATVCMVTPVNGVATATLLTSVAGVANIEVRDANDPAKLDTLTVGITAATPSYILLQATPTVLPRSVGTTLGYSKLLAMVFDSTGAPVGDVPVAFSIVPLSGTNSGETVSPVVVFTASTTQTGLDLGAAPATFTAGSLPSSAKGVRIRATVVGTTIETQDLDLPLPLGMKSSFDAAIVIGGQAGSIAFGEATTMVDAGMFSTFYTFPMSVLVADSNGSPAPQGTVVNISAWPIAWTTGPAGYGCLPDADGFSFMGNGPEADVGTFLNEDVNENLILDAGEDGRRVYHATGTNVSPPYPWNPHAGMTHTLWAAGTADGQITPQNSWGGTVRSTNAADLPGTASTDANGLATFNLTYTKSAAYWIKTRIRAQTMVQGTPAVGQLEWRMVPSKPDVDPDCLLPPSPFSY